MKWKFEIKIFVQQCLIVKRLINSIKCASNYDYIDKCFFFQLGSMDGRSSFHVFPTQVWNIVECLELKRQLLMLNRQYS